MTMNPISNATRPLVEGAKNVGEAVSTAFGKVVQFVKDHPAQVSMIAGLALMILGAILAPVSLGALLTLSVAGLAVIIAGTALSLNNQERRL